MRDYSDDPPEVDPDYGVFADPGGTNSTSFKMDYINKVEERIREHHRRIKEHQSKTGQEFNTYMIQLFNERSKK